MSGLAPSLAVKTGQRMAFRSRENKTPPRATSPPNASVWACPPVVASSESIWATLVSRQWLKTTDREAVKGERREGIERFGKREGEKKRKRKTKKEKVTTGERNRDGSREIRGEKEREASAQSLFGAFPTFFFFFQLRLKSHFYPSLSCVFALSFTFFILPTLHSFYFNRIFMAGLGN